MHPKVVNQYAAWRAECCKEDIEEMTNAKSHKVARKRKKKKEAKK